MHLCVHRHTAITGHAISSKRMLFLMNAMQAKKWTTTNCLWMRRHDTVLFYLWSPSCLRVRRN